MITNRYFEIKQEDDALSIEFDDKNIRDGKLSLETFINQLKKSDNMGRSSTLYIHFDETNKLYPLYFQRGKLDSDVHNLYHIAGNRLIDMDRVAVRKSTRGRGRIAIDVFLRKEPYRGYLLYKQCLGPDSMMQVQRPKFGTTNLPEMINYIEDYCKYIQNNGDSWFSDNERLCFMINHGKYIVESENGGEQIIFMIIPTYWVGDDESKA